MTRRDAILAEEQVYSAASGATVPLAGLEQPDGLDLLALQEENARPERQRPKLLVGVAARRLRGPVCLRVTTLLEEDARERELCDGPLRAGDRGKVGPALRVVRRLRLLQRRRERTYRGGLARSAPAEWRHLVVGLREGDTGQETEDERQYDGGARERAHAV